VIAASWPFVNYLQEGMKQTLIIITFWRHRIPEKGISILSTEWGQVSWFRAGRPAFISPAPVHDQNIFSSFLLLVLVDPGLTPDQHAGSIKLVDDENFAANMAACTRNRG
jgi:hypothetical protein